MSYHLKIDAKLKSPKINCDSTAGTIVIEGRSIMENPAEFYSQLNSWIDTCNDELEISIEIKLEYINSSSKRTLFQLLKKLNKFHSLKFCWYYPNDDEDIKEIGEDFKTDLGLPIELISLDPDEF